jgi:hypothetical protein
LAVSQARVVGLFQPTLAFEAPSKPVERRRVLRPRTGGACAGRCLSIACWRHTVCLATGAAVARDQVCPTLHCAAIGEWVLNFVATWAEAVGGAAGARVCAAAGLKKPSWAHCRQKPQYGCISGLNFESNVYHLPWCKRPAVCLFRDCGGATLRVL